MAFVFVNVYSSTLTAYFSVRYKSPEINSLQDLAASRTQRITTLKGSVTELALMVSYLWRSIHSLLICLLIKLIFLMNQSIELEMIS